jgi:hypothetical protein
MSLRCKGLSWLFISLTFTFSFKKEYSLSSKEKRRRTWNDVLLSFVSRRQWACYLPPNLDILSSFCVLCANTIITSFSFFVQKFWVQLKRQPRYSTRVKLSVWLIQFSSEKRISFQSEIYWERKRFSFFFTNQQKKRADWNLVRVLRTLWIIIKKNFTPNSKFSILKWENLNYQDSNM